MERSLNDVAVAGWLPSVSAEEMSDGPETRCALQFQIAAAAVQAQSGTLHNGARPNELLCAAISGDGPFLPVKSQLLALEAAGLGEACCN